MLFLTIFSVSLFASNIPSEFKEVKKQGGITEYQLEKNGLTVLLLEDHSAPVLTFMVTYRVGSRNEVTGTTGATHILEHLMFKGTEKYNKANGGHIDAQLGNIGARLNATTWMDRTNYYESIPSNYLELAIDIESDRMRNLWLKKEDKESEMTVVRNEFERGENSPFSALNTEVWATAFQAHPYHHNTIGWRSDIENVPMEKLRAFYDTFYWPNNATVTIIGDFKTESALELVNKYYGEITTSPNPIPQLYTVEPIQRGERRTIVSRAGQLGVVGVAHKVPEGSHVDTYPLVLLDYILSNGKTSRFYKALVDQGKAVNVFDFYVPLHDPSIFTPYVFLSPGATHNEVEEIILAEIEKIKTDGITEDELQRAISQITAETAYGRDGSFSIASKINEAIAMGDWTFYVNYLDNLKKVTTVDIQEVVKKYFVKEHRTVGYFIPKTSGGNKAEMKPSSWYEDQTKGYYRSDEAKENSTVVPNPTVLPVSKISDNIKSSKVAGIKLLTAKTGVKDVVTFTGSFAAGDSFSPEHNSAIADLTGYMLDKGTEKNDKFALAEKLENLGAELSFSVGTHTLGFNGKCLSKDVDEVIGLLAEQLRTPAFSQEEFEKLKLQRKGSLQRMLEDTNTRASEKADSLLFPVGHPNHGTSIQKLIDDVDKVTRDDVLKFYSNYYGPKSMIFVLVGDLDNAKINSSVEKYFSGWNGGVDIPQVEKSKQVTEGETLIVKMKEKTSATLYIAQTTGIKRTDKDYTALSIGNSIFGMGGFSARLMSIVRDDEGLTYGIYSVLSDDTYTDGQFYISGTFSPDLLAQGYSSTMREFKRWVKDGVTENELKAAKTRAIGSYKVGLSTTRGIAGRLLSITQRGYEPSYMDEYSDQINNVTLEEVNAAIKKYINPDKVITVVAGTVTEENLKKKD
ncbi:MAG: pitrilysin family protein [Melioribacteraceae bacterium]|jgi:zinc protease|nr:pitrilysin family protein [Melioribacteraceae bacterium]